MILLPKADVFVSARALADRYLQSKDMMSATEEYYQRLSAGILVESRHLWEQEILHAETTRFADPSAMDILAARIDSASKTVGDTSDHTVSLLEEAINLALDIEEKQLSFHIL